MADFFVLPWQRRVCIYATVTETQLTECNNIDVCSDSKRAQGEGVDSVNREAKNIHF